MHIVLFIPQFWYLTHGYDTERQTKRNLTWGDRLKTDVIFWMTLAWLPIKTPKLSYKYNTAPVSQTVMILAPVIKQSYQTPFNVLSATRQYHLHSKIRPRQTRIKAKLLTAKRKWHPISTSWCQLGHGITALSESLRWEDKFRLLGDHSFSHWSSSAGYNMTDRDNKRRFWYGYHFATPTFFSPPQCTKYGEGHLLERFSVIAKCIPINLTMCRLNLNTTIYCMMYKLFLSGYIFNKYGYIYFATNCAEMHHGSVVHSKCRAEKNLKWVYFS